LSYFRSFFYFCSFPHYLRSFPYFHSLTVLFPFRPSTSVLFLSYFRSFFPYFHYFLSCWTSRPSRISDVYVTEMNDFELPFGIPIEFFSQLKIVSRLDVHRCLWWKF
jgi:hypothetical protein